MICDECEKEIEINRIFDLCQDCYNDFLAEVEKEWKDKFRKENENAIYKNISTRKK